MPFVQKILPRALHSTGTQGATHCWLVVRCMCEMSHLWSHHTRGHRPGHMARRVYMLQQLHAFSWISFQVSFKYVFAFCRVMCADSPCVPLVLKTTPITHVENATRFVFALIPCLGFLRLSLINIVLNMIVSLTKSRKKASYGFLVITAKNGFTPRAMASTRTIRQKCDD